MTGGTARSDETLTVAFSLHSNPGAYALLLGAGASATSGIPTAWGVLEDLVTRASVLHDGATDDPMAWYEATFGTPPTYEGLLERLAPTQIERQRLLRRYFERSAEDVEAERKLPTAAHRSIARLVRSGAVKVIMTLNFDHLIEQALRAEGIEPTVIATPADVTGMAPLHTLDCCVIHLHGDYLNPTSMLNTVTELEAYHPATAALIRRVLEDYGLIIAGWSSRYDPALRDAISAHYPHRYTLTWFEPAPPTEEATRLLTAKKGALLTMDADTGFGRLADAVSALAARRARNPLTIPVAVETAKRELAGRTVAISLHDTLRSELQTLHQVPEFHLADYQNTGSYNDMLTRVEEATRLPAGLIATLAYWGNDTTDKWWADELPRFATAVDGSGAVKLLSLRVVSGSMLFFAAGIAAVAAQRYGLLSRLFALRRPNHYNGDFEPLATGIDATSGYCGPEADNRLFDALRPVLDQALSLGSEALEDAWQVFEVVRLMWATMADDRFAGLKEQYDNADSAYREADDELTAAKVRGDNLNGAMEARAKAWQERDRLLGAVGRAISPGRPHILTADFRGDEHYRSVVARRLLQDLDAERSAHPFVTSGLVRGDRSAAVAMEAVSRQLGAVGHDLAWGRVRNRSGVIPMRVWLDSGLTPEERAQQRPTR